PLLCQSTMPSRDRVRVGNGEADPVTGCAPVLVSVTVTGMSRAPAAASTGGTVSTRPSSAGATEARAPVQRLILSAGARLIRRGPVALPSAVSGAAARSD